MIVALEVLKRALNIKETDDSLDTLLTETEVRMATWVESQTNRKFSVPAERVDYKLGSGRAILYVWGRIAGPAEPDSEYVYITVAERYRGMKDWAPVSADVFERRGNSLVRNDGWAWSPNAEYKLTYKDGWHDGDRPQDIQDVVIELVKASVSMRDTNAAVTEEQIGDYRYYIDRAKVPGLNDLSVIGKATMNGYLKIPV